MAPTRTDRDWEYWGDVRLRELETENARLRAESAARSALTDAVGDDYDRRRDRVIDAARNLCANAEEAGAAEFGVLLQELDDAVDALDFRKFRLTEDAARQDAAPHRAWRGAETTKEATVIALATGRAAGAGRVREHTCQCGAALGTITREKDGPTVLTPYPGVALQSVTGGVVWLLCPCGQHVPWFCASRSVLRATG